jgi:hypothetical protein
MTKRQSKMALTPAPLPKKGLDRAERVAADAAVQFVNDHREAGHWAPRVALSNDSSGAVRLDVDYAEEDQGLAGTWLHAALGGGDPAFLDMLVSQLTNARGAKAGEESRSGLAAGLGFVAGLGPQSPLEAALAAQMYATHCATMTMSRGLHRAEMRDALSDYARMMNQTARTFAAQVEALAKLRSGGKQQVEVRYVYVNGNAVIGDVHTSGGRGLDGVGQQPHAPAIPGFASAPGVPMWGADPARDAMSVASDPGPQAMQDARGKEPRRSEGPR